MHFRFSTLRPFGETIFGTHTLAAISDPPETLWIRARRRLQAPCVAIIGSRVASPYALEVARQLGADLARRGITVISGMARGVDSAAHRGALEGGGATIAVFGCASTSSIRANTPGSRNRFASKARSSASFRRGRRAEVPLSESQSHHSGLSLAVVIVEAADKSGSSSQPIARFGRAATCWPAREHPRWSQLRRAQLLRDALSSSSLRTNY